VTKGGVAASAVNKEGRSAKTVNEGERKRRVQSTEENGFGQTAREEREDVKHFTWLAATCPGAIVKTSIRNIWHGARSRPERRKGRAPKDEKDNGGHPFSDVHPEAKEIKKKPRPEEARNVSKLPKTTRRPKTHRNTLLARVCKRAPKVERSRLAEKIKITFSFGESGETARCESKAREDEYAQSFQERGRQQVPKSEKKPLVTANRGSYHMQHETGELYRLSFEGKELACDALHRDVEETLLCLYSEKKGAEG